MAYFTGQLPRWATGASAPITPEPTEGKKDTGWAASEKPPYQYFNWWMRRVYERLLEVDDIENRGRTWAAKHTFGAGLASSVAPSAATDLVRKTELDAEASSRASAIAAIFTTPQTFSAGLSSTQAPASASSVVRKTDLDNAQGGSGYATLPAPSGWTGQIRYWRSGDAASGVVHLVIDLRATGASPVASLGTMPVGFRPGTSAGTPIALPFLGRNGTIEYLNIGNTDGNMVTSEPPTQNQRFHIDARYILGSGAYD